MPRPSSKKGNGKTYLRILERFLAVVGAVTLLTIAVFCLAALYSLYAGNNLDPSAELYASESGRAILSVHSAQDLQSVLLQRLSPEAQKTTTKDGITGIFESINKLGKLEDYKGVGKVQIHTNLLSLSEGAMLTYTASAVFENGTGLVKMTLARNNDKWLINGFYVTARTN